MCLGKQKLTRKGSDLTWTRTHAAYCQHRPRQTQWNISLYSLPQPVQLNLSTQLLPFPLFAFLRFSQPSCPFSQLPCPLTHPLSSCRLSSTFPPFLCHTLYSSSFVYLSVSPPPSPKPLAVLQFFITPTKIFPSIHFNDQHTIYDMQLK